MPWQDASYPPFERLQRGERLNRKERREVQQRLNLDDPGLDIIHRDAAGIDVGNESHFVSVPPDRDPQPTREFGSWMVSHAETNPHGRIVGNSYK